MYFTEGLKPYNIHVKKHKKKESAIYSKTYLLYTEDTESICLTPPPQTQDASKDNI
jgi:hypothetical protein